MINTTKKPYRILITDDDRGCRESLREIVEPEGFETFLASCGEEALDIVRDEPIHLALFDVHMPTLTGIETLELVRQINNLLPVILVTANPDEDLMRKAFRARAYSVIPKPVSKHVVLYMVVRALRVYDQPRTAENKPAPRSAEPRTKNDDPQGT